MISPKISRRTTVEVVWEIPAPAYGKDVIDVLTQITDWFEDHGRTMYDDSIKVEGEAAEWLRFTITEDIDESVA